MNLWLVLSIVTVIFENIHFTSQLKGMGVPMKIYLFGTPVYSDYLYFKWCKENTESPFPRIIFRVVLWANFLLALKFVN